MLLMANPAGEVDRACRACRCQAAQASSGKIRSTVSGQRRGDKYGQSWLSSFRLTLTALGMDFSPLADTFNNESVIDRPVFAVLGDVLVGLAVNPILCGFYAREFHNDHSLNRITFKDFVLSIGCEHFDRMTLHRCFDSSPIFVELFLLDGFSSREDNVC